MEVDKINLTAIKETKISENCRIGNKQISSETKVTSDAEINLPTECSISFDILRCRRTRYTFDNKEINRVRIRRVSITRINSQTQSELQTDNKKSHIITGTTIGIICLIILIIIMAIKKFKTSTPNNSRSPSPNSSDIEEIKMEEMAPTDVSDEETRPQEKGKSTPYSTATTAWMKVGTSIENMEVIDP